MTKETLDFTDLSKLAGGTGNGSGSNNEMLTGCKKGHSGGCQLLIRMDILLKMRRSMLLFMLKAMQDFLDWITVTVLIMKNTSAVQEGYLTVNF